MITRLARIAAPVAAAGMVAAGLTATGSAPALAWKPTTHMLAAEQALQSIDCGTSTMAVNTEKGTARIPLERWLTEAVCKYPKVFMAGVTGPDAYPTLTFGQSVIHPEHSDRWIERVWRKARHYGAPGSAARLKATAFAAGFRAHGAGDFWGHQGFINVNTGGAFPDFEQMVKDPAVLAVGVRHVILEGFVDSIRPGVTRDGERYTSDLDKYIKPGLSLSEQPTLAGDNSADADAPPYGFIREVFVDSPEARAEVPKDPVLAILLNCKFKQFTCSDLKILNQATRWLPDWLDPNANDRQRAEAADWLARNAAKTGSIVINSMIYGGAKESRYAPGTASAINNLKTKEQQRYDDQFDSFFFDRVCPIALKGAVCNTAGGLRNGMLWLADKFKLEFLTRWYTNIKRFGMDHALGYVFQAAKKSQTLSDENRKALNDLLDVDGDGKLSYGDLHSLNGEWLAKKISTGMCPTKTKPEPCFPRRAEIMRSLGLQPNQSVDGTTAFDAEKFSAYGNSANLIKLSFITREDQANALYHDLGGDQDKAPFRTGQAGHELDLLQPWMQRFDGWDEASMCPASGKNGWELWKNDHLRKVMFDRLFREPMPGFFDKCR